MSKKVLSISVAAYNVEDYIQEALESLVIPETMSDIEVLVIIDGSTDATAKLAKQYEFSYPDTFKVIEKDNGGYGSTVNRGLEEAQGKYFKILDGDDWINGAALAKLVVTMKESESDLFFMPKLKVIEGIGEESDSTDFNYHLSGPINIEQMKKLVGHWNMAVRTEVLKKGIEYLPEHLLYTDQLFVIQSIALSRSFEFFEEPVYCYRVGRDGQSVTKNSRIAHLKDAIIVTEAGNRLYEKYQHDTPSNILKYLEWRISIYYCNLIRTCLLAGPSLSGKKQLINIEYKAQKECLNIYKSAERNSGRVRVLRATKYACYWPLSLLTQKSWA